jgi:hypothetical protein
MKEEQTDSKQLRIEDSDHSIKIERNRMRLKLKLIN